MQTRALAGWLARPRGVLALLNACSHHEGLDGQHIIKQGNGGPSRPRSSQRTYVAHKPRRLPYGSGQPLGCGVALVPRHARPVPARHVDRLHRRVLQRLQRNLRANLSTWEPPYVGATDNWSMLCVLRNFRALSLYSAPRGMTAEECCEPTLQRMRPSAEQHVMRTCAERHRARRREGTAAHRCAPAGALPRWARRA